MKELLCPHFTPSRRQPQCCRRRAGREAGSVSNASRAVRPGRKTRPLLRCPARPSAGAAASALPTAAPKDSCCTCRGGGERSELCFKCFQGSAAGTESAAPLAVPGAAVGGRSRLGLADRCAKKSSLHSPQAAVGFFAHAFRRSGPNPGEQSETPRTFVRGFFWRRRRDLNPRAGFPTYALSRGASSTS